MKFLQLGYTFNLLVSSRDLGFGICKMSIGSFSLSMKSYIDFQSMESLIRGGLSEQAKEGASVLLLPIRLWGLLRGLSTGFMGCSFTLRTR